MILTASDEATVVYGSDDDDFPSFKTEEETKRIYSAAPIPFPPLIDKDAYDCSVGLFFDGSNLI